MHKKKAAQERVEVRGRIDHFFFTSETFSAGVLIDQETGAKIKFAGSVYADLQENVALQGSWQTHDQFGLQLKVDSFSLNTDLSRDGLVDYLAKSKAFTGIGRVRAEKIVDTAKIEFGGLEAALKSKEMFAIQAGVPLPVIEKLDEEWNARLEVNRATAGLAEYGVTAKQAGKLIGRWGSSALKIVREDPFWLIGKVPGMGFRTVDEFAMKVGISKTLPGRIKSAILYAINQEATEGHTWTPRDDLTRECLNLLDFDGIDDGERLTEVFDALVQTGDVVQGPESFAPCWRRRLHDAEAAVVARILKASQVRSDTFGAPTPAHIKQLSPMLNDLQAQGISNALSWRFSVITGGAGTGKTFGVSSIVDAVTQQGKSFELAAPTGRAARRLEESVGHKARTIHMLLEPVAHDGDGDLKFRFGRNAESKLATDLVVIDEVSMCDVPLLHALFEAVDWDRTTVVLVGDHNQLPPVGPGAVLRDLVKKDICNVTRLTDVVRQAGALKRAVYGILHGKVAPGLRGGGKGSPLEPWYVFANLSDQNDAARFVATTFKTLSQNTIPGEDGEQRQVDPVWDVQFLTPQKKGALGTQALNVELQRLYQASLGRVVPPVAPNRPTPIMIDDKVMMSGRNDYKSGLMNGTIGRVLEIIAKGDPIPTADGSAEYAQSSGYVIEFEGRKLAIEGEMRKHIQHAYAITIHKSQGSEYPVAVTVCHRAHRYMHHRGLIYTAVGRAKFCSILIGDNVGIQACVRTVKSDSRRTMFALRGDAA